MGSIVAVVTGKGGAGKTTLLCCLAVNCAVDRYKVAVVDGDPSKDFTEFHRDIYQGAGFPPITLVTEADPVRLVDAAQLLAETHDIVFIDTAGFGNQAAVTAISTSEAVLIPSGSARKEMIEAEKAYGLVTSLAKGNKRTIHALVVPIGIKPRSAVGRFTYSQLAELNLPTAKGYLSDRVAYIELTHSGLVPISGTERQEISRILDQMRDEGWIPGQPAESE